MIKKLITCATLVLILTSCFSQVGLPRKVEINGEELILISKEQLIIANSEHLEAVKYRTIADSLSLQLNLCDLAFIKAQDLVKIRDVRIDELNKSLSLMFENQSRDSTIKVQYQQLNKNLNRQLKSTNIKLWVLTAIVIVKSALVTYLAVK